MLPWTVLCMSLAAVAATGLPPFGLFFSEMTVFNGGFKGGATGLTTLILLAVLASFCGILYQLTRVLLGAPKTPRASHPAKQAGVPAMGLMLGALLLFSLWMPAPVLELMRRAAGIIGGHQ